VPVEQLLRGGVGTLALAPISAVAEGEVRRVIRTMKERLSGTRAPRRAADIWAATYVLLGLRYSDEFAHALFEEVLGMEESATYQAIVRRAREEGREEGRAEEARRLLLLLGEPKLGPVDDATRAAIEGLSDLARLEELLVRSETAASWQELLPTPGARRRNGRRRAGA
jgi:predicted transposase YdaD